MAGVEHENRIPLDVFNGVKMARMDFWFKVSVPQHENCNHEIFHSLRSVTLVIVVL